MRLAEKFRSTGIGFGFGKQYGINISRKKMQNKIVLNIELIKICVFRLALVINYFPFSIIVSSKYAQCSHFTYA